MSPLPPLPVILVLAVTARALADPMPLSPMTRAASPDLSRIARVSLREQGDAYVLTGEVSLYVFDESSDSYRRYAHFDLGEDGAPEHLFIPDDGEHLIAISTVRLESCIRVYRSDGKLLKKWALSDILTEKEMRSVPRGGAHTPWFRYGRVYNDHMEMDGRWFPAQGPPIGYDFVLDLEKLVVRRRK